MLKEWALTPVWEGDMDQIRPQRNGWALCQTNIAEPRGESGKGVGTAGLSLVLAQSGLSSGMWL